MDEAKNKVILVELPAAVGESVWIVSAQKRRVYVNTIAEYVIRGDRPGKNSVKIFYVDKDGMPHESWWDMTAFGRTLFTDPDDAFRRMEEVWDK